MELLWILLAIVAIIVATYYRQTESMTNADVQSAMQKYGGTQNKPQKYQPVGVAEFPIYGPKIKHPPVDPTEGNGKSGKGKRKPGIYPDIYGPDLELIPGTKPSHKHRSDDTSDPTYDFNPDLQKAFPTEGPPQPFLTDFSKFQH